MDTDHDIELLLLTLRPKALSPILQQSLEETFERSPQSGREESAPWAAAAPSPLPADLAERLETILARVPHPGSRKVIHFPSPATSSSRPAWHRGAAAAAVALLGTLSALVLPLESPSSPSTTANAGSPGESVPPPDSARRESIVPARFRSGLREAKDAGIVWQDRHGPQRMLQLVYRDHVTMSDASGRIYQVERPRVEYLFIPAQVD